MPAQSNLTDDELIARGMAIAVHARKRPNSPAVISAVGNRTWAELDARANQLARVLQAAGIGVGDGVAVLAPNTPEFVETVVACLRIGARMTPVNWHQSDETIAYVVDNCEAKALVASARFTAAASAAGQAPNLRLKLAFGGTIEGFDDYEASLNESSPTQIADAEIGSFMLYTSGTTGRPKGVYRRNRPTVSQLTNKILETAAFNPEQDLALVTGPLYHAAPLSLNLVTPINAGVGVVLMDKWDAEETLRLVDRHRITHTHVVPTMLHRMLQLSSDVRGAYDLTSLRWVLHGAAPCPPQVKQDTIAWLGPVLYEYYSSTEGGGVFVDSHQWLERPGTVGKPVAGVELRLLDENGNPVPQGTSGLIYIKAPEVGRFEYFREPNKTTSAYRGDYYTLGDMGYFDADGFLFLTGRTAELIISGGVNIYPVEIDEVLIRHEAVADAAAVGVPNEDWGEEIKAVVELKPGFSASPETAASILEFARGHLASYQRPRSVDFVERLPRSAAGKVLRQEVRAPYWKGRSRTI